MSVPRLILIFGCLPHVPSRCGETPEHMRRYLSKRAKGKGKAAPKAPCDLCHGKIADGLPFCCAQCHSVARDRLQSVLAHELPSLSYDRRKGEPKPIKEPKAKAGRKPKLTEAEKADLAAELASEGIDDPSVAEFLATLAVPA